MCFFLLSVYYQCHNIPESSHLHYELPQSYCPDLTVALLWHCNQRQNCGFVSQQLWIFTSIFPLSLSLKVLYWLVIRSCALLNGSTSAQLPAVNWLVQAVTRGGGSCSDQICFILKAYSFSGKIRNYPLSQSQINPWLNAPIVNPDTMSKECCARTVSPVNYQAENSTWL